MKLKWILSVFIILGLLNAGLCKTTSTPDDYEEIPQDEDEYDDDDSSKNNEAVHDNNIPTDVDPPPYFLVPSITINASKGEDVILNCDAKNLPKNHIVMWYNGSQLIATQKNVINKEKVTSLYETVIKIHNVEYSDRNQYLCSILPHKVNLTILLNVFHEKRAVAIYSHGRDVTERSMTFRQGDRVEFECRSLGMNNATIKWSLNGERAANHVKLINDNKVVIESIDEHQGGIYQCLGDDGTANNLPVGSITINVQYAPKVSTHKHYVNTKQGGQAELNCDYKSEPIAVTEWKRYYMNQYEVIPTISDKYTTKNTVHKGRNTTTLFIKDVNRSDLGEYQCFAKNSIGSAHANIHVIYEPEKPRFENKEIIGRTVTIHWLVKSEQPIGEAAIDYKLNGTLNKWKTESISRSHHDLHTGVWKLTHELELSPGTWHVRIKVKNSENWSKFSDEELIKIEDPVDTPPEDIVYAGDIAGKIKNNNSNQLIVPLFLIISLLLALRIVPSI